MEKRLTKRLIALILTGGILLSSTGVYTALAASEEYTTSEYTSALVGSDETATNAPETTVPSASESATSVKTEAETTTEKETEAESTTVLAEKPATTVKNETTTLPPFVDEEDTFVEKPADNKATEPDWPGSGTADAPFEINSAEEFLGMNEKIAELNNHKYFQLTGDIYLDPTSINLGTHSDNGMPGSLISVVPNNPSESNFFHLDGNGMTISFKNESTSAVRIDKLSSDSP